MARHLNDSNYYCHLSLRSGNTVSLRKLTANSISVHASAPLTVNVGTWYSLRLKAVGSRLRGCVNRALVLETRTPRMRKDPRDS
jgi:pectate lyase